MYDKIWVCCFVYKNSISPAILSLRRESTEYTCLSFNFKRGKTHIKLWLVPVWMVFYIEKRSQFVACVIMGILYLPPPSLAKRNVLKYCKTWWNNDKYNFTEPQRNRNEADFFVNLIRTSTVPLDRRSSVPSFKFWVKQLSACLV